jgi:Fuc2NAc and GlcNAc transferase
MVGCVQLELPMTAGAVFSLTALLTWMVRGFAVSRGVIDVPNERSSHSVPTPRAGGIAIVTTVLVTVALHGAYSQTWPGLKAALLLGGTLVAVIGFIDDWRPIAAWVRLSIHFLAVAWCAWSLGALPPINFGFSVWHPGLVGAACAVVFLVWFVNLYNFMDGVDGIASVEAISVGGIAAALLAEYGGDASTVWVLVVFVSAVGGFLLWNWPPAKIFLGDTGSGFLGIALGAIAWATVTSGQLSAWVWLILVGSFVSDATVTLFRRWRRGERLQAAHRSHAYQRLSRRFGSHLKVTLIFLAINLGWLGPLAWAATVWPSSGGVLTLVAWTPLAILAWRRGAGLPGD